MCAIKEVTGDVCERGRGSVHELCVTFGPRDDHVHPDPHGLRRRRHHEVEPVVGLDAEGEGGVGALGGEEEAESEGGLQGGVGCGGGVSPLWRCGGGRSKLPL